IVWIPSKVWFKFLAERIKAIRDAQMALSQAPVHNHGIMTAILLHIMRHTFVNPQRLPTFLRSNLRALRYEETSATFGMFFLHNLDLRVSHLPEIDEADCDEVRQLMGHKMQKKKKMGEVYKDSDGVESPDFPLGPNPSWERVVNILAKT